MTIVCIPKTMLIFLVTDNMLVINMGAFPLGLPEHMTSTQQWRDVILVTTKASESHFPFLLKWQELALTLKIRVMEKEITQLDMDNYLMYLTLENLRKARVFLNWKLTNST